MHIPFISADTVRERVLMTAAARAKVAALVACLTADGFTAPARIDPHHQTPERRPGTVWYQLTCANL